MKALITLVLVFGIWWVGKSIYSQYQAKEQKAQQEEKEAELGLSADGLTGMPPQFAPSLQTAQSQGAGALKAWLDRYRGHIRDPKLAAIELDYAQMLARQDPAQAQKVFQTVKRRTPTSSPIYERVKKLEATLGP